MAIVATAIQGMPRDHNEEYYDVMILSETESYDAAAVDRDAADADWDDSRPRPRCRRRHPKDQNTKKLPKAATLKKPRKKQERKDWCARMMRQLEIRCVPSFVLPAKDTRRDE
jgi:hypothetical protein